MEKEIKDALYRAYYNGNSHASMSEDDNNTIDEEFDEWYKDNLDWIKNLSTNIDTSDQFEHDALLENVTVRNEMKKEFEVKKLKNGMGHGHLVVITEPAIEDIHIGTVIIIPIAEGFKEPKTVVLQVDEKGFPVVANNKFAIVTQYKY